MTSTVGEVIVAAMACHGADYAFCVPGESYLPVLDAFHDEPAVQPIATHHEEGAGFMAHAWARATGRTGVAMVTRGAAPGWPTSRSRCTLPVRTPFRWSRLRARCPPRPPAGKASRN